MFVFLALVLCLSLNRAASDHYQFRVIKEWRYVNYTWPNEEELRSATATGEYNPNRCVMTGVDHYDGYYYIATPRMFAGVPITLSRVPDGGNTSPLLEPFPSWRKNRIGDCDALQNVQNIQVDNAGNLYVIDSGRSNTIEHHQSNNYCPAKIVKFDLKTRDGEDMAKEVFRYVFPASVADSRVNYLYELVLDDDFVYISDNSKHDPGLIVFSEADMKSWKIRHGTFKANMNATTFNVSGTLQTHALNLAGLALDTSKEGERTLYYSPISSYTLFAVNTSELKNPLTTTLKNVQLIGRRSSQSDGMIADDQGVLYFGLLGSSSIAMWDTTQSGFRPTLIAHDPEYVQWPNAFSFNSDGELVVLCNTLAKFIAGTADLNQPNFRFLAGNVSAHSYVHNSMKFNQNTEHVYFSSVKPNVNTTQRTIGQPGEAWDVNDLLIRDDLPHPKSGASAAKFGACLLVVLACAWMLQVRN
ncbi:major royal jelly protein 1-like [Atheta coriaria]|uniref:major royal jelly protein 1-like n=1 Tax=Dalotia coriaria TaxID=877792 RepID=UPI0031F3970D